MVPALSTGASVTAAPVDASLPRTRILMRWINGRLYPVGRWRVYLLVFFAASLSCTVTLKVGEIQFLELIFALDFLLLAVFTAFGRAHLRILRQFFEIAKGYATFIVAAFILSLVALRGDFSAPHLTFLKTPVVVTVARIGELCLDAFYMLYLGSLFREDKRLCKFGALTYFWTGIAGCLYSFITYPLNVFADLQLGTYLDSHRMRGFNNEGGPFGVYLISVMVLAVVVYRIRWISRATFWISIVIMTVAMAGSASKSALFGIAFLGVIALVWLLHGWRRWVVCAVLAAAVSALGTIVGIQDQIEMYRQASIHYRELSNLKSQDGNFVMGRVSGTILAPRMIEAHPLVGIGWGNYPLVRDNPEYRQGGAFEIGTVDAPSLGVVDYIVELGIPLWIYLVWVQLIPVAMVYRAGADVWLVSLALVQPVSNWVGAHLNLGHPWVAVALALGLAYRNYPLFPAGGPSQGKLKESPAFAELHPNLNPGATP